MKYLQIVDWETEQSYRKDRGTPPWIKVYRRKMTNGSWSQLSDAEKGQFICIQLVGADTHGKVPADPATLKKIAMLDKCPNINKFIELGFFEKVGCQDANHELNVTPQPDAPETETETETETEEHIARKKDLAPHRERFEQIWTDYPEKKGKEKAWLKFKNQVVTNKDWVDIQKGLVNYIADVDRIRGEGQDDLRFQYGSTWFHQNWKDYVDIKAPPGKDGSCMAQAVAGRGPFVDKVLTEIKAIIAASPEAEVSGLCNTMINLAPEDDSEAFARVLYEFGYTEHQFGDTF